MRPDDARDVRARLGPQQQRALHLLARELCLLGRLPNGPGDGGVDMAGDELMADPYAAGGSGASTAAAPAEPLNPVNHSKRDAQDGTYSP